MSHFELSFFEVIVILFFITPLKDAFYLTANHNDEHFYGVEKISGNRKSITWRLSGRVQWRKSAKNNYYFKLNKTFIQFKRPFISVKLSKTQ